MGPCCAKPAKETEKAPTLSEKPTLSDDQTKLTKIKYNLDSNDSITDTGNSVALKQPGEIKQVNVGLLEGTNKGYMGLCDPNYQYQLGVFFDIKIGMWFRLIYVHDDDIVKKQFMGLYGLDLRELSKEDFERWCTENGYFKTKELYDYYVLLDFLPFSRLLAGLSEKYDVKFHMSDTFLFKGRGPYRAITCCGEHHVLVEKALNEYEARISKKRSVYNVNKHWDNLTFIDPTVDISDHTADFPFSWPKRKRPNSPSLPGWPYSFSKTSPTVFHQWAKNREDTKIIPMENTDILKSYNKFGVRTRTTNSHIRITENTTADSDNQTDLKSLHTSSLNTAPVTTSDNLKKFFEYNGNPQ